MIEEKQLVKKFFMIVLVVGALLRLWGIDFGLPNQYHQDESIIVHHALAYGTGDLNPHFFAIPPLASYVLFIAYALYYIAGRIAGFFPTVDSFAISFLADPGPFYLAGRIILGVIPGLISIWLVYVLYKRLFPRSAAIEAAVAALFMAVNFLNVVNAHYIYVDTPAVACVLAAFLFFLKLKERPTFKNYILTGIWIGLCAGMKYNMVLIAMPFLIIHILAVRQEKGFWGGFSNLSAAASASVAAFIAVNPFSVLDFVAFRDSFFRQVNAQVYTGWLHHLVYSLTQGIGLPIIILGLAGFLKLFFTDRKLACIFVSFPLIFYCSIVFAGQHFSRYALPLVPFLCMAAAYAIIGIADNLLSKRSRLKTAVATILILGAVIPTLTKAVWADILFSSKDTRTQAADWIQRQLNSGSAIACDSTFFRPPLKQTLKQLEEKKIYLKQQEGLRSHKVRKLDWMLQSVRQDSGKRYRLYFMSEHPQREGQFLATTPAISPSFADLEKNDIQYVVINSTSPIKGASAFYSQLRKLGKRIAIFSPYRDGSVRRPYDQFALTCLSIDSKELFSRRTAGPVLEIYQVR